jgi:hypothetical protein
MQEKVLERQGQEIDLLARWWAAVADLERAEARLARLEATKERQVSRMLEGMTPRQRTVLAQGAPLRTMRADRSYRAAVRRRQLWAARQPALRRLEAEWEPRLAAAHAQVNAARTALADLAAEALATWQVRPERFTRWTHRQLQHLAHQGS